MELQWNLQTGDIMTVRSHFPWYKSKNPGKTIFCTIYENRKELNLNIGCKYNPVFWDKIRQRVNDLAYQVRSNN